MTLRTFAGLGALLSSKPGFALFSRAKAGAGDTSLLCCARPSQGLALGLVMGMPGRLTAQGFR